MASLFLTQGVTLSYSNDIVRSAEMPRFCYTNYGDNYTMTWDRAIYGLLYRQNTYDCQTGIRFIPDNQAGRTSDQYFSKIIVTPCFVNTHQAATGQTTTDQAATQARSS